MNVLAGGGVPQAPAPGTSQSSGPGPAALHGLRRTARAGGLRPALAELARTLLPGLLPCGPSGHAVVAGDPVDPAPLLWVGGRIAPRHPARETVIRVCDLPGGPVTLLDTAAAVSPAEGETGAAGCDRTTFTMALLWVRLGLAERLRSQCLEYLGNRRSGDTVLLQQQLVKGTLADVLAEHLEIGAVLEDTSPESVSPALLYQLHTQLTMAERQQVRLLGAGGFLSGGPGETAYLSELLAEVHAVPGEE